MTSSSDDSAGTVGTGGPGASARRDHNDTVTGEGFPTTA